MKTKTYFSPTEETYSELQSAYDYFNKTLFNQKLPPCLITLQRHGRYYGYFSPERFKHRNEDTTTDEIAINRAWGAMEQPTDLRLFCCS